jgi:hypothetical protein
MSTNLGQNPREDPLVHGAGTLEVKEVAHAFDDLHSRVGGEVTLGVGDERDVDAAVAIPVEVQRRLRRGAVQRCVLGVVGVVGLVLVEPGLVGSVVADRRRGMPRRAQALLGVAQVLGRVIAGRPVLPEPIQERQVCAESGNPCKHSANGPLPASRSPNSIPFAVTRPRRMFCAL